MGSIQQLQLEKRVTIRHVFLIGIYILKEEKERKKMKKKKLSVKQILILSSVTGGLLLISVVLLLVLRGPSSRQDIFGNLSEVEGETEGESGGFFHDLYEEAHSNLCLTNGLEVEPPLLQEAESIDNIETGNGSGDGSITIEDFNRREDIFYGDREAMTDARATDYIIEWMQNPTGFSFVDENNMIAGVASGFSHIVRAEIITFALDNEIEADTIFVLEINFSQRNSAITEIFIALNDEEQTILMVEFATIREAGSAVPRYEALASISPWTLEEIYNNVWLDNFQLGGGVE